MMWQTIIHLAFLLSAIAIAYTDRLLNTTPDAARTAVIRREDGV